MNSPVRALGPPTSFSFLRSTSSYLLFATFSGCGRRMLFNEFRMISTLSDSLPTRVAELRRENTPLGSTLAADSRDLMIHSGALAGNVIDRRILGDPSSKRRFPFLPTNSKSPRTPKTSGVAVLLSPFAASGDRVVFDSFLDRELLFLSVTCHRPNHDRSPERRKLLRLTFQKACDPYLAGALAATPKKVL